MQDQALDTAATRKTGFAIPSAIRQWIGSARTALPGIWREHGHWLLPIVPLLLMLYTPVLWCVQYWTTPGSPYIFQPFIPFMVAFALWVWRKPIGNYYQDLSLYPADSPKRRGRGGLTVTILGCILMLFTYATKTPTLSLAAFVLIVYGTVYHVYGRAIFVYILPHLLFLLLIIPPPLTLLSQFVRVMQLAMASIIRDFSLQAGSVVSVKDATVLFTIQKKEIPLEIIPQICGLDIIVPVLIFAFWLAVLKECQPGRGAIVVALGGFLAFALAVLRVMLMAVLIRNGMTDSLLLSFVGGINAWFFIVPCFILIYWVGKRFKLWI